MKLGEYVASGEFLGKNLKERESWLSSKVPGYAALPPEEKRKLLTGFKGARTAAPMSQEAATYLPPMNPMKYILDPSQAAGLGMGKTPQTKGIANLGQDIALMAAGGGLGGEMGGAGKVLPFLTRSLGEGAGMAASNMFRGGAASKIPGDLARTAGLSALMSGLMGGVGRAVSNPSYARFMHGMEDPAYPKALRETGGNLPKATQEESTEGFTRMLRKTTGKAMEPSTELGKLADQYEAKFAGSNAPPEIKAAKEHMDLLDKSLKTKPKQGLWASDPDSTGYRRVLRKKGVELPSEDLIKKAQTLTGKPTKGLPQEIPISPRGATHDQEEQIAYHLRRLQSEIGKVKNAKDQKPFIAQMYRLRRWIDHLRDYGGEEVKDAKSLQKGFKMRMDNARSQVQELLTQFEGGREIQAASKQSVLEKAGRAYGKLMPEGRGSIYHMGARVSPFLAYHLLGMPFLPAFGLTAAMSSPKLAQSLVKYGPETGRMAARGMASFANAMRRTEGDE